MGMATGGGGGVRSDINVTPLVDVVLVLLIIFMVLTPLMEKEMAVRVPETEEAEAVEDVPVKQVVLTAMADGSVYLNKERLTLEALPERLERMMRARPDKIAFVNAEDSLNYERVVQIIDLARSHGVATVGMITTPPKPEDFRSLPTGDAPPPTGDAPPPGP